MSRVIIFSRIFQKNHPRAGEPTWFVEKVIESLVADGTCEITDDQLKFISPMNFTKFQVWPKWHTIRSGNRWKVGDRFSPRCWSGKPYASKQVAIAPDIEIKQLFYIEIDANGIVAINGTYISSSQESSLAKNDGLSVSDFNQWLIMPCLRSAKPFKGQIICWSETVKY